METSSQRLKRRSKKTAEGCLEWQGCLTTAGYGAIFFEGRKREAHLIAYETFVGRVPKGKELDHLCRNRKCINTAHLEPVTHKENVRRGEGACAKHARKTRCVNGHPFNKKNTYVTSERRRCRECEAARGRAKRRRDKKATSLNMDTRRVA